MHQRYKPRPHNPGDDAVSFLWFVVRFLVIVRFYQLGLTSGEWLRCSAAPASGRRCRMATTANSRAIVARAVVVAVTMRLSVVLMGEIVRTPSRAASRQR